MKGGTELSDRDLKYKRFWTELIEKYKQKYPEYKYGRAIPTRSTCVMSYGGTGIEYDIRFRKGSIFITLYNRYDNKPDPHEIIDMIISRKSEIEEKLGLEVEIEKKENQLSTHVETKYYKEVNILNISDKEKENAIDWIIEWMPKFKRTLQSVINEI